MVETIPRPLLPATRAGGELNDLVRIRLLGGSAADADRLFGHWSALQAAPEAEADLTVRLVDRLPLSGPLRLIGRDDAGFADGEFVLFGRSGARASIPFDRLGGPCEIVCERRSGEVPLLGEILRLTLLARGVLPLHASAFVSSGAGVAVTGWADGSKTGTLLAFMARGARFVADDWVYVSEDGARLYGLPEPVTVKERYLRDVPEFRKRLSSGQRARLAALKTARNCVQAGAGIFRGDSLNGRAAARLENAVDRRLAVTLQANEWFGPEMRVSSAPFRKLFLTLSCDAADVRVERAEPDEVAERVVFSLRQEQSELMSCYTKFRYAFPGACNPWIESSEAMQREVLKRALAGKETYVVTHPYPVSIPVLQKALAPFVEAGWEE